MPRVYNRCLGYLREGEPGGDPRDTTFWSVHVAPITRTAAPPAFCKLSCRSTQRIDAVDCPAALKARQWPLDFDDYGIKSDRELAGPGYVFKNGDPKSWRALTGDPEYTEALLACEIPSVRGILDVLETQRIQPTLSEKAYEQRIEDLERRVAHLEQEKGELGTVRKNLEDENEKVRGRISEMEEQCKKKTQLLLIFEHVSGVLFAVVEDLKNGELKEGGEIYAKLTCQYVREAFKRHVDILQETIAHGALVWQGIKRKVIKS